MATTTKRLKPTNQNITIPDLAEAPNITVITDGVGKNADAINALWDGRVFYGTSSTAAGTQAKAVTITDFPDTLTAGLMVRIKFSNNQTYNGQPQLKINSLEAVDVCRYGTTAAARYEWIAGQVVDFVYDGTNFVMVDGGIATTTYYGRTKLSDSITSNSTSLAATANAVKQVNDIISDKFKTWTGGTETLVGDGQTWLCGGQLINTTSAADASGALCIFSRSGSVYRITPVVKTSNATFVYNSNGVFGVQIDGSYTNVKMFAIRLI